MGPDPGFGIYIHWPFCQAKCPYCDFNSHVSGHVDTDAWKEALVRDIKRQANLSDPLTVTSIFFGGGTPSLMPPPVVGACLDAVAGAFRLSEDCEVSLEANPTSSDAERFSDFQRAGVGRLSLGIQALNDRALKRLGRLHTADEAIQAFDIARQIYDRVSFDLIYARQDQDIEDWKHELELALDLAADHLSLYQLTIEPGTRFGDLSARGRLNGLPSDQLAADLYELTTDICGAKGFEFYEVSNAARNDASCKHNLTYWRYGPYLGVGPGAHGRRVTGGRRVATEGCKTPGKWLAGAEFETTRVLEDGEESAEYALMGLRLTEGISVARLNAFGGALDMNAVDELCDHGLLEKQAGLLRATHRGRLVLNTIVAQVLI